MVYYVAIILIIMRLTISIILLIIPIAIRADLYVEKSIMNKIVDYKFTNITSVDEHEVLNIILEDNYIRRIIHLIRNFNITFDQTLTKRLWIPFFPAYGSYCGFYNTDYKGSKPIDMIDRMCQVYKICNGDRDYESCYCNRQLQYHLINYNIDSELKNNMLLYLDRLLLECPNFDNLDRTFQISSVKGLNYLPIYPLKYDKGYVEISSPNLGITIYEIDTSSASSIFESDKTLLHIYDNITYLPNTKNTYIILNSESKNSSIVNVIQKVYNTNLNDVGYFFLVLCFIFCLVIIQRTILKS